MSNAPIALFLYNRPEHTQRTLDALVSNEGFHKSELYVFCDGPKEAKDLEAVLATREVLHSYNLANAKIIERQKNLGLARSIITGVSELCHQHGRTIVLEDDLITSPYFLEYMNHALNLYADDLGVMQVSGYMFPIDRHNLPQTFFLNLTTSWGWGVWDRSWKYFDSSPTNFIRIQNEASKRENFDLGGMYPYFKMLKSKQRGKIDSWAIDWYASVFCMDGVCLFPAQSLVRNIGHDNTGVHCGSSSAYEVDLSLEKIIQFPEQTSELPEARRRLIKYYQLSKLSLLKQAIRFIQNYWIRLGR